MESEESLCPLIREDCTKVLGGPSNGETCDACGETIAKNQLVMDCIGEVV